MPLEGKLGELKVASEEQDKITVAEEQVVFSDASKQEVLHEKFLESKVGKGMQEKLRALKEDTELTVEGKRDKLVTLIQDFFEVGNDEDEQMKRLVGKDGKQYLRIKDGKEVFDITLDANDIKPLIQGFIDWYLERSAAVVNGDEQDEEKKIKLVYEKEKLIIEEIEQNLVALETNVRSGLQGTWEKVKGAWNRMWKGEGSFEEVTGSFKDRVSGKFAIGTSMLGSFAGLSKVLNKKNPAKAAESEGKRAAFTKKFTDMKDTVMGALGFGGTPKPPVAPGAGTTSVA